MFVFFNPPRILEPVEPKVRSLPPKDESHIANGIGRLVACLFEPDDIVEVRCLGKPPKPTKQFWFKADELPAQAEKLNRINANGYNVYFGVNPREQRSGAKDDDVALARCLFVDFDHLNDDPAVRLVLARQRIDAAGLPKPTLLIDSGHGIHCYWLLPEPLTNLADWRAIQKRLIDVLDSDETIHNPSRIMRLPGFQNVKREPYQPCKIIEASPARRYALAQIEAALPIAGNGRPSPVERARLYVAKIPGEAEKNRNNAAYRVGCKLRDFGLSEQDGWPILFDWNRKNSPPLDDAELRKVYQDAMKYAKGQPGSKLDEDQGDGTNDQDEGDDILTPEVQLLAEKDSQTILLAKLNKAMLGRFGGAVRVASVEKVGRQKGEFVLVTEDGQRINLGNVSRLTLTAVSDAVLDQTAPPVSLIPNKKRWPEIRHCIVSLARVKDTGDFKESVAQWIREFVGNGYAQARGLYFEGEDWSAEGIKAISDRWTVLIGPEGELLLCPEKFLTHCRQIDGNWGIKDQPIHEALVALGFTYGKFRKQAGGIRWERWAWQHPDSRSWLP